MPEARSRARRTFRALDELGLKGVLNLDALAMIEEYREQYPGPEAVVDLILKLSDENIVKDVMRAPAEEGMADILPEQLRLRKVPKTLDKAVLALGTYVWEVAGRAALRLDILENMATKHRDFVRERFRRSCALSAVAAQSAALVTDLPDCPPRVFYYIGLLHDLGILALWSVNKDETARDEHASALRSYFEGSMSSGDFRQFEATLFGIDHAAAGAYLLKQLKFVKDYDLCIRRHHVEEGESLSHEELLFRVAHALSCLAGYAMEDMLEGARAGRYVVELKRELVADLGSLLSQKRIKRPIHELVDAFCRAVRRDPCCIVSFSVDELKKLERLRTLSDSLLARAGLRQLLDNQVAYGTLRAFVDGHPALLTHLFRGPLAATKMPLGGGEEAVSLHWAADKSKRSVAIFILGPLDDDVFLRTHLLSDMTHALADCVVFKYMPKVKATRIKAGAMVFVPQEVTAFLVCGRRFGSAARSSRQRFAQSLPEVRFVSYYELAGIDE